MWHQSRGVLTFFPFTQYSLPNLKATEIWATINADRILDYVMQIWLSLKSSIIQPSSQVYGSRAIAHAFQVVASCFFYVLLKVITTDTMPGVVPEYHWIRPPKHNITKQNRIDCLLNTSHHQKLGSITQ